MARPSDAEFLAHVAEMTAASAGANAALEKAREQFATRQRIKAVRDSIGDDAMLAKAASAWDEWYAENGVNPPGLGSLTDYDPDGESIPARRPVASSGRGASDLAGESRITPGDGSTRAANALGRELAGLKSAVRKARAEIERILDEEPEPHDANQHTWANGDDDDISDADLLTGKAVQTGTVSNLLDAIAGRSPHMPRSLVAKGLGILGHRIDAAASRDELDMLEQIAASTLLSMLPACAQDERLFDDFKDRLAKSSPAVQKIFGV